MQAWWAQRHEPLRRVWDYYRSTSLLWSALSLDGSGERPEPAARPDLVDKLVGEAVNDASTVAALGHQYGFKTLFVRQPTVADKTEFTRQERSYAGWLPDATKPDIDWWSMPADLKDLYQAVGRKAQAAGAVVLLQDVFNGMGQSAFIDWMHPSEAGNERIARAVYPHIESLLMK